MKFKSIINIYFYIILLSLASGISVWLLCLGYYSLLFLLVLIWGFCVYKIVSNIVGTYKKISFMFNCIECDDYTFKFSEDVSDSYKKELNASLNRIKELMAGAKAKNLEKDRYYELIMNSVRGGIITVNENGNIYQVNNYALKLFGMDVFTHLKQLRIIDERLASLLLEIKSGERKQFSYTTEKEEIKLSILATAVSYGGNMLKIISLNDINRELDENEVLSWIKITRVLTHEIMNSLAPISSLSHTLMEINKAQYETLTGKENVQLSESYFKEVLQYNKDITNGLNVINDAGNGLMNFVQMYRKLTHLQTPIKEAFSLLPFLEGICSLVLPKDFTLLINVSPLDIMLYADKGLISQVVVNILKNAVYSLQEHGLGENVPQIEINAFIEQNESIHIEFINNGPKIPHDIAENIFMPFFSTKQDGSGIGLSLSRQIMHNHGGSINLSSNKDGKVGFSLEL